MARLPDGNLSYFPLDCNFFSNQKIKALRRKFGSIGISTYLWLLAKIYGGKGYYLTFSSVEDLSADIAEDLASEKDQLGKISRLVSATILELPALYLADEKMLANRVITSHNIQSQYVRSAISAKKKVCVKEFSLLDNSEYPIRQNSISSEEMPISTEEMAISSEVLGQSKVKESKDISKYVSKDINTVIKEPRASEIESYEDIMDDMAVTETVKPMLWEFIKHCQLNKHILTNDKLTDICIRLDFAFPHDEMAKAECLKKAVNGGYYDIKEI